MNLPYKRGVIVSFLLILNFYHRVKICLRHGVMMRPQTSRYLPGVIFFLCPKCFEFPTFLDSSMRVDS